MTQPYLRYILVLAFAFGPIMRPLLAQVEGISIVSAENYYLDKDYRNALIGFEEYLLDIQFDKEIAYKAGICASRLGIGKKAIGHILSARKAGKKDNYLPFWLGRAYHLNEQWDSAYKYLNEYLDVFPIDKAFKRDADRFIAQIDRAKQMAPKTLQPYVIENLGSGINSAYSEFHPLLSSDGKMMVYTARRKGYTEEKLLDDGEYKEKIFSSRLLHDGTWSKGIPIRLVEGRNKDLDYNLIQFIDNGTKLLLYKSNEDGAKLYVSEYQNETWKLPYLIPIEPDPRFFTGDIVFSHDLKKVIFTTNGSTNHFQNDFYTSTYDEKTEKWSEPQYLSKIINTPEDEGSPFLLDDKTLIFSSKTESGLGDFDIYKSTWDETKKSWGKPVNLGFPYNTPNNDLYFFQAGEQPDVQYFSSVRGTTKGLSDIYKLTRTALTEGKGIIKDDQGKPIISQTVQFDDPENYQNISVSTDQSGKFSTPLVCGQTYQVRFKAKDGVFLETLFKVPFPASKEQLADVELLLTPRKLTERDKEESNQAPGE